MANDEEELSKPIGEPGAEPGSHPHEMPQNGGQSQSADEPEETATQLPEAELSLTAPPESQTPAERHVVHAIARAGSTFAGSSPLPSPWTRRPRWMRRRRD